MSDRFLVWLSAGVLTAGVSAATVVGAGVATAQDGAGAGADGHTTSQSSDSPDAKADSDDTKKSDPSTKPDDDADSVDQDDVNRSSRPVMTKVNVGTPAVDTEMTIVDGDVNDDVATDAKDAERRRASRSLAGERERPRISAPVASVPAETVEKRDESETAQVAKRDVEENAEETNEPPADQHAAPDQGTVTVTPVVETQAPVTSADVSANRSRCRRNRRRCGVLSAHVPAQPARVEHDTRRACGRTAILDLGGSVATGIRDRLRLPVSRRRSRGRTHDERGGHRCGREHPDLHAPTDVPGSDHHWRFYEVFRLVSKVTGIPRLRHPRPRYWPCADPPFFLTWGLDTQRTVWTAPDGAEWKVLAVRTARADGEDSRRLPRRRVHLRAQHIELDRLHAAWRARPAPP